MNNVLEITESSFETEVLQAQAPVVVDFYAQWCGPCKMLAPLFEQLAVEFKGRVKCSKANVDDTPELAAAYRITGVPTLALFRGGEPIDALVGLVAPKTLKSWLEGAATTSPLALTTLVHETGKWRSQQRPLPSAGTTINPGSGLVGSRHRHIVKQIILDDEPHPI